MSCIDKLLIDGFRSYCHVPESNSLKNEQRNQAKDQQTIVFQKPVTLIWGHNGAGKTTIIECLKLATTGQHPPNSDRGKTFVTDSQLLRQTETQAVVQLEFESLNHLQMTIRRHFKVAAYANSISISSLRSTLHYRHPTTGELQSLSQTCIEMDTKIPQLLGVSTSILTHVIFCHQEEAMWIFSDNQTLKKIFDELFDTTKFAKLQDWIKDTIKTQSSDLKKINEKIALAKRDVDDAIRARENITKELLYLQGEGMKMKASKEVLDHLNNKCDPELQKALTTRLNAYQEKISILKYRIQENEAKIKQVEVSSTEKKLTDDREILTKTYQNLKLQLEKVIVNLERTDREVEGKRQDLLAIDESDNLENTLKHELKQLKSQASSLVTFSGKDTDEFVLKQLKSELTNLQMRLASVTETYKIPILQAQQQSSVGILNEKQASIYFIETQITKLQMQIKQTQEEINDIRTKQQSTSRYDQLSKEQHQLKHQLEEITESYYSKQAQLQKLQKELTSINQKPLHEYQEAKRELLALQQSMVGLDKQIGQNSIRFDSYEDSKAAIHRKLQVSRQRTQMQYQRIQELTSKQKINEEQILDLSSQLSKLPKNVHQIKVQIDDVKQRYREEKDKLIKMNFSAGEFMDQYLQLSTDRNKCLICYKAIDSNDIQGIKDRRKKHQNKFKDQAENFSKAILALKLEKDKLKQSSQLLNKYDEIQQRIEELTMQVSTFEEDRKKATLEYHQQQSIEKQLEEELNVMDKMYPLVSQRNHFQSQFDQLTSKIDSMLKINPRLSQDQNLQKEVEDLQRMQSSLYRETSELTQSRDTLQSRIKQIEQELKQLESQYAIQQRDQIKLPELIEKEKSLQRELRESQVLLIETNATIEDQQKTLQYQNLQLAQAQELRDQHVESIQQALPILQHIIPLFERALEKQAELRNLKKNKQSQFVEQQREKLKHEIEEMEQRFNHGVELRKKLDVLIPEHENKLKNIEQQLEAVQILKQNKAMIKEVNDVFQQTENERARLEELCQLSKERDKKETQILAERVKIAEHFQRCMDQRNESEVRFKNSERNYLQLIFQEETIRSIIEDLVKYQKEAEQALIQYHREKMEEINKSINDTWQAIYDGDDIRRIFIKSDEDTQSSKRTTKSYFYRIVMESKSGVEMDMRGRSSMGQKVLASIVIRLALSESFGNQCSVLALDEPTTNLDRVHILKLANALSNLVELLQAHKQNLQLIIITHDKDFVRQMSKFTKTYIRIEKKPNGFSKIEQLPIETI